MEIIGLLKEVYVSYHGDGESHRLRIFLSLMISILISVTIFSLGENAYNSIALTISVLTGFTFTAIFSSHTLAAAELPAPQNETDRVDVERLEKLGENFRIRSRFFVAISIFALIMVVICYVKVDPSALSNVLCYGEFLINCQLVSKEVIVYASYIKNFLDFVLAFVFFESLYTFYRLSETALAMTDTRRRYMEGRV